MSLVRVTGSPGSGKTESCELLEFYGYESFDVDRDKLAVARNISTGEIATDIGSNVEWWRQNAFELDEERILAIKSKAAAENRLSFVCGTVTDDSKLWDQFDLNIALYARGIIASHRLENRPKKHNDFGRSADERQLVLARMPEKYATYRNMGAIVISSEQPPNVVVNQILTFSLAVHNQG